VTRWTADDVADHMARVYDGKARGVGGVGALDLHGLSAPRGEPDTPPKNHGARIPRGPSALESELAGHLSLMGLKPETQFRFDPDRQWRLDFAFPDVRIGVEVDGAIFAAENGTEAGRHARGAGRCADMEKRNAAAEAGWRILAYGPPHVRTGQAALQIERLVRKCREALAQGSNENETDPPLR